MDRSRNYKVSIDTELYFILKLFKRNSVDSFDSNVLIQIRYKKLEQNTIMLVHRYMKEIKRNLDYCKIIHYT